MCLNILQSKILPTNIRCKLCYTCLQLITVVTSAPGCNGFVTVWTRREWQRKKASSSRIFHKSDTRMLSATDPTFPLNAAMDHGMHHGIPWQCEMYYGPMEQ